MRILFLPGGVIEVVRHHGNTDLKISFLPGGVIEVVRHHGNTQ